MNHKHYKYGKKHIYVDKNIFWHKIFFQGSLIQFSRFSRCLFHIQGFSRFSRSAGNPVNKEIPTIPPLLVNGDIITNFEKADLFNKFFVDQCAPFNNLNKLPPFYLKTDKKLCNLSINENDISTIIRNLDLNKSHGWDNIG